MKLSVSLSDDDVAFLDGLVRDEGYASRSAALRRAVRLLRSAALGDDYEQAWAEWADSGEAELWEATTADGAA